MLILDTIAPVFLVVAVGAWLQRGGLVSPGFLKEANRLTYSVGLPALFFAQLAAGLPTMAGVTAPLAVMVIVTGLLLAAGFLAARCAGLRAGAAATFVQGAFRGNLAFIGLPVVFALPDVMLPGGLPLHQAAVILVAPMMVLYNILGVVVLLAGRHRFGWTMILPLLKQLVVTPPLVAILAGMAFAAAGWTLPSVAGRTLNALGEMALPLGLLGVGGSLVTANLAAGWRVPLGAALLRTALAPLLGWVMGRWWGLDEVTVKLMMIFLATPTAIASYTVALALQGDERMASGIIGVSTITSVLTLSAVVAWA